MHLSLAASTIKLNFLGDLHEQFPSECVLTHMGLLACKLATVIKLHKISRVYGIVGHSIAQSSKFSGLAVIFYQKG